MCFFSLCSDNNRDSDYGDEEDFFGCGGLEPKDYNIFKPVMIYFQNILMKLSVNNCNDDDDDYFDIISALE